MEKKKTIFILDYTEFPGPRYCSQGEFSGEEYYHNILNGEFFMAVKNDEILEVNLDNTAGYASSFLDEAFGNLVFDFSSLLVKKHLEIISEEESDWKTMIEDEVLVEWEERRESKEKPKKTETHPKWYTDKDL